jgi:hypothetical protein
MPPTEQTGFRLSRPGGVIGRRGKQGEQNGGEGGCWKASHADLREHCRERSGGPTILVPVGGSLTFVVAVGPRNGGRNEA